jgi:phosphoglycolate phosphatase-like HAD superfamily hydrolase
MNHSPALVFDLDGTLIDTAPDILGALNFVLLREGRRPVTRADLRHLVGHGAQTMLAEAFRQTGAPLADSRARAHRRLHRPLPRAHRRPEPPFPARGRNACAFY